jgi:2-dehydro-3-deoxyphosphogluconate aldolase/(4S)-4-hydroxy-2-oxoglutarate aldolase
VNGQTTATTTAVTPGTDSWLRRYRAMAVLTLDDPATAVPVARALYAGGVRVAEVLLRTPAALECVRVMREEVAELTVGLGTVTTPADIDSGLAAGAAFLVTPGLTPTLLAAARGLAVPLLPGVATASELMQALEAGIGTCKLFPASVLGAAQLAAFAGPFPQARFCATGGVRADNAAAFLAQPNVTTVGLSWIAPADAIAARDYARIRALAAQAAAL